MPSKILKVSPEEYVLSVLTKEERIDAALAIAGKAFKKTDLTMNDIEKAVKTVRKKLNEKK